MGFELTAFGLAVFCFALIGCFSIPTLFALWLSKSRLHWLFQSLLILATASTLVVVRAYDLMLIVLVASYSVLTCSWLIQYRSAKTKPDASITQQPRFQLDLKDIAATFVLLGSFAALLAHANRNHVWSDDLATNCFSVIQCVVIGLAVAIWSSSLQVFRLLKFRYWLPWFAILLGTAVAASLDLFIASKFLMFWSAISSDDFFSFAFVSGATSTQSAIGWTLVLAVHAIAATSIAWLFSGWRKHPESDDANARSNVNLNWLTTGKAILGSTFVLLFVLSLARCYLILWPPPPYQPMRDIIAGQPNSFPKLFEIGALLSEAGLDGDPVVAPSIQLASDIKKQAKTFENLEQTLDSKNCFWTDWRCQQFDFDMMDEASELRVIARALSTRSLQELSEGRHDNVIKDGILCFKLADQITIDGNMVQALVGCACEGIGVVAIFPGIAEASDEHLKLLANHIDDKTTLHGSIDAELERLVKADEFFIRNSNAFYWLESLWYQLDDQASSRDAIRGMLVRRNTLRELLRTEVAIAMYRSEKGKLPGHLEDLVPEFISSIPHDRYSPVQGQPLQYILSESQQSYQLYSCGLDNDDDGGKTDKDLWVEEGDIDLQVLYKDRLADNAKEVKEYEAEQAAERKQQQEYDNWEEGDFEPLEELSDE